jgi:hypothetical protein
LTSCQKLLSRLVTPFETVTPIIAVSSKFLSTDKSAEASPAIVVCTTRNTVIECVISEVVHFKPLPNYISIAVQNLNRYR